ncbi:MAG: chorismate synthase [Cyanobacteria bacterium P01_H01_bin.74]
MTAGNSFGQLFRITTFGESHGGGVGVVIDGCPPGLAITPEIIQQDLDRRRPGQSHITTPRNESDTVHILSGVMNDETTGMPIMLLVYNKDARSQDYDTMKSKYRPGHADYTFTQKYGRRDWRGGGRASARETVARVAAGAVARQYLKQKLGIVCMAYVSQIGPIKTSIAPSAVNAEAIESNIVRCPDAAAASQMIEAIETIREEGDSLGGTITGILNHVPVGLGEPVFDKLHADLAKAMLSINAVKGFDIGLGFDAVSLKGSEHNDAFHTDDTGAVRTITNHAGGVLGGISTGEPIYFRVAVKPTSTIRKMQQTVTENGHEPATLTATGRHDPCVLPRAVPIVEAMAALVLMDHYLRHKAQNIPIPVSPATKTEMNTNNTVNHTA